MADPRVTILKRNGLQTAQYSDYTSARIASVAGDVLMISGDLDEQIILKDKVDIWILPGVVLNFDSSGPTIIAPTTGEVNCNIYGQGIIKNDDIGNCIFIDNAAANLSIECDLIEGIGGSSSVSVNIRKAYKFHLTCNKVYSEDYQAIRFGEIFIPGLIQDINLKITKVETGNLTGTTGTTAITTRGNGFVKIEEILCRNRGHCLSHREGDVTAQIKKLQTTNNITGNAGSALHVRQYNTSNPGTGTQKLIIYFDEIESLTGNVNSSAGIEIGEGTGVFIGRKVYCDDSPAIQIQGNDTKGYIKCNEIISQGSGGDVPVNAIEFSNFTNQITLDAKLVQGYRDSGVIYINRANVLIRNAFIRNTYHSSSPSSVGIFINGDPDYTLINLINTKIVTGNISSGRTIYYAGPEDCLDIKNYGLFVNKAIDSNINLLIGTDLSDPAEYNYQYIEDAALE